MSGLFYRRNRSRKRIGESQMKTCVGFSKGGKKPKQLCETSVHWLNRQMHENWRYDDLSSFFRSELHGSCIVTPFSALLTGCFFPLHRGVSVRNCDYQMYSVHVHSRENLWWNCFGVQRSHWDRPHGVISRWQQHDFPQSPKEPKKEQKPFFCSCYKWVGALCAEKESQKVVCFFSVSAIL